METQSEPLLPALRKVADFLEEGDFSPALAKCQDEIDLRIAQNFADATDATGSPWPPRVQPTGGWPLLIKTQRLVASVLGPSVGLVAEGNPAGLAEHVRSLGPREASIASTTPYAAAHEHGVPSRNLPARPYMGVNDATLDKCAEIVADFAAEEIAKLLGQ